MNSAQVSMLVVGLVLVFGTFSASAIRCFVCNSGEAYDGEACTDLKDETFLIDCDEYGRLNSRPEFINGTKCRKQVQTVDSETRIVRGCAAEGRTDRCVERTGTKEVKVTYCQCLGEGCNAASSVLGSIVVLTIAYVLTMVTQH